MSCLDRRELLRALAAGGGVLLLGCYPKGKSAGGYDTSKHYWGYAIDTTRCIGCCACMRACRAENDVPRGSYRTWVERYQIGADGEVAVDVALGDEHVFGAVERPSVKAFFVPKLCNHCEKSVCSQVCPVGATYRTEDGVVLVDRKHCVGCGYCVQACPYGTRFINPVDHTADKCTLCYHRVTRGLQPACVEACPKQARLFGDLKDPRSSINTILRQRRYRLLRPDLGTHPKCYYIGLDLEVV
jgi:Fe-S-cluster-containing dehydrogenase component